MVREACKHLREELLTKKERERLFSAILSGPSKEDYREMMGKEFREERYTQYQQYFHRKQLKPFTALLFGEYASYLQKLEAETEVAISDEDYIVGEIKAGFLSHRSPRPTEELAALDDKELLTYINEWDSEHHDPDDWFIEITIEGLTEAFKTVQRSDYSC